MVLAEFSDRDELIAATLALWEQRETTEVIAWIETIDAPRRRLIALARLAHERAAQGTSAQAGVLAAASDRRVGTVLRRVTATRLTFLERLYSDLGLALDAARRHARLAYVGIGDLRRAAPDAKGLQDELAAQIELMIESLTGMAGIVSPLPICGTRSRSKSDPAATASGT
ncbi:MAG: TetR/AcrR family transcriptional regulator [Solirubrobacteraceae bacterium]